MSRNYGLGSREMSKAGQFALNNASKSGHLSYSSAATIGDRWSKFSSWGLLTKRKKSYAKGQPQNSEIIVR